MCSTDDPGFPSADRARWYHNGNELTTGTGNGHIKAAVLSGLILRVPAARAKSAGNYTCQPMNSVGRAELGGGGNGSSGPIFASASLNPVVYAPPRFIKGLEPVTGRHKQTCSLFSPLDRR